MILLTCHFGGNMHDAATQLNKLDLADYLVQMDMTGNYTICVLKVPNAKVGLMLRDTKQDFFRSYIAEAKDEYARLAARPERMP